jgi:UDP-N-acetyl-D-glucosamine dehydrogenase
VTVSQALAPSRVHGLQRVAIIGQGYVGLPLAMAAVEVGYEVVGIDADKARVQRLLLGDSYVDDVADARLRAAIDSGRFAASEDYARAADFDVAVITVPTPLRNRSPDLSFVIDAARSLAGYLKPGSLVILESTTYPGTTEELLPPVLEKGSGLRAGPDFLLGYSPERVDPGNTDWTLSATPKVVAGIDDASLAAVRDFYGKLVAEVVPVSSTRAAELTKLLENTFRHVNIALANEFGIFARELGIDVREVIRAASTKPFGFMPFYPGPGVGGHCIPIDPKYLSWHIQQATGRRFRFVELANDINEQMPEYVVQRITQGLNRLGKPALGSRVLMLGLAYKKNSSDARESPAIRVAQLLLALGSRVDAIDTHVPVDQALGDVRRLPMTADAVREADAVVLLADHDDLDYELVQREARWVLDCRDRLHGANVESL